MQDAYSKLDLTDRVVIVTGGGSGIGQETAKLLAGRGAKVTIADVNDAGSKQTLTAIEEAGGRAIYVRTDVSKEEDVETLVDTTIQQWGGLHGAFNNAGVLGVGSVAELTLANWQKTVSINLTGVFLCMKYQIAHMLANGGGSIVNMASGAGLVGVPGAGDYNASKHGVVGLTRSASTDYSARGIRVNAVAPGLIETPMTKQSLLDPVLETVLKGGHPMGRIGQPTEVAEAVAWLLSEASSFVTGAIVSVDGGYVSV